jgi:ParB family transcriptional regulator, chromosome partitioning protein
MHQQSLPLGSLVVSKLNTRKDLASGQEDSTISDLAASIRQVGLLSPLTVRPNGNGKYEVLAGQRRLLACQQLGMDPVPCVVRDDIDDNDATTISLVENLHRADMSPLDKARALKGLYDQYGSYERVARETAWTESTIRKYCKLLDLPQELQEKLNGKDGAVGINAMAALASTYSGAEAISAYGKIAGFKGAIQEQILKRSGGDIAQLEDLRQEAIDGAFDTRHCGGRFGCEIIRDIIEGEMDRADFESLVAETAQDISSGVSATKARKAARDFWKLLARG